MEPWVPIAKPQPQRRPVAQPKGLHRGGYHKSIIPHSQQSGEKFYQWSDLRGGPPPWPNQWADYQRPSHPYRPGDQNRPHSRNEYYEGGYPSQLYPRPGYENPYQNHPPTSTREEYTYGSYYHGPSQLLKEERVPRQGSPYTRHGDYRDQNLYSDYHEERQSSPFGTDGEIQFRSKSYDMYKESPASGSDRQERPEEEDLQNNALEGAHTQLNELSLSGESSLLQQYKDSGLSSSSYELSQYMLDSSDQFDSTPLKTWSPVQTEDASVRPVDPMKFFIPHTPVCFGPGGQLILVCPNHPAHGQAALVEVHSLEVFLNDTAEQEELRAFSGPLIREDVHKVDVMLFCQQKAALSSKAETPRGRDLALLWKLLVLLCRQNGSMVGSDVAELLMQDCKRLERYKRQAPVANLINLTDDDWPVPSSGTPNLLTGEIPPSMETPAQIIEKFTKLLFYGRKKEALEWAMRNHLWGHALFLSSKMDPRTYSWVMNGFISSLALNDPLQTLFQLMSGRIPQAATCCGDQHWGDWRPHLAVMLSNHAGDPELHQRAIITMGDTLAGKGLLEAAHFCYLMAHLPFGHYTVKTDHLVLLGSSHSQEFLKFATTEAIQRTEIFEYCQMLGRPKSSIPSFQVYKLLYASRLADYGLTSQALHYCEGISSILLSQTQSIHPVLLAELIKLSEQLKLSDPLLLERRHRGKEQEPGWLVKLRERHRELKLAKQAEEDPGDPDFIYTDILKARQPTAENNVYQDPRQVQGYSDPLRYPSSMQLPPEGTGLSQPNLQQHPPFQPDLNSSGEGAGHPGTPVPLYARPETTMTASSVTTQPEEDRQVYLPQEDIPESQNSYQYQYPEIQKTPLAPRVRGISESSTISCDEEKEDPSDDDEKKAVQDNAKNKKESEKNAKGSGFGWFGWFRSKPTKMSSVEEDSSDSPDSEETPTEAQPPLASTIPSMSSMPFFLPHPGANTVSSPGDGERRGSMINKNLPSMEGSPHELPFNTTGLPPPPTLGNAVPLYNPSQVPQLYMTTSVNRPNRLAQRRYPTQS
ncbi:protein transport protein Sec16B isoform X2 [Dromiciops gliroides]|uniref:protein transport protein Sec16B isoform X2 n=1 Tax=Dromiciops gliroides TaxID=33562 RepID=UPI001CC7D0C6|nr:protein transport protein Sec16B isoform X2 [Dromiciops gliroides]